MAKLKKLILAMSLIVICLSLFLTPFLFSATTASSSSEPTVSSQALTPSDNEIDSQYSDRFISDSREVVFSTPTDAAEIQESAHANLGNYIFYGILIALFSSSFTILLRSFKH